MLSALALPALAVDKIANNVDAALSRGGKASVLVSLGEQSPIEGLARTHSGDDRLITSVATLRETATRTQAPLRTWLNARKLPYKSFWVANFIALDVDAELAAALAARADVAAIELDSRMSMARPAASSPVTSDP